VARGEQVESQRASGQDTPASASICAVQTRTWREFSATYLPRFAGCFFGLIAVRIWIQCCLYDLYTATDSGLLTIVANFVRVVFIVVLMVAAARKGFSKRQMKVLDWFSVTAMTIAAILYLAQPELPGVPLSLVACIFAGLGIVWGGGTWIRFYVRLEPGEALIYTFACLGASSLVGFLLGLLPEMVVYAIAIFMPTLSLVSYWQAMATLDERRAVIPEPVRDNLYDAEPKRVIVRLLTGIALLEFALGVARGFPFGESIPMDVPLQFVNQASVAVLSAFVIWWVLIRGRGLRFGSLWRFQVALMVVGTALIATLDADVMSWGATIITISNTLMLGILWYCIYDFSRHSSLPSYVVLGAVWIVHMLPRELGRWAIFSFGPRTAGSVVALAIMVCLIALSMAFVLRDSVPTLRPLFAEFASSSYSERFLQRARQIESHGATGERDGEEPDAPTSEEGMRSVQTREDGTQLLRGAANDAWSTQAAEGGTQDAVLPEHGSQDGALPEHAPQGTSAAERAATKADDEAWLDRRCKALQTAYRLTDRETEMVRYIAQGRSKGYIGNALYISENTVKSYTRNVYQKLCVHSKQDLLDVLYAEDDLLG